LKNGAKKTPKSIEWLSEATGGIAEMINNFDIAIGIKSRSHPLTSTNPSSEKL
jgi:hypothetical protein